MLRHIVGDEIFFEILRSYASNDSLAYNAASTSDFQKVCEDISGEDFEQFFQQWIYGDRYPKYELSWWMEDDYIYKVKIDQIQSYGIFSMPIDLKFSGTAGPLSMDTTIVIQNSSASHIYEVSGLDFFVENVTIDPDNWILKEATYVTNGIENIVAKQIALSYTSPPIEYIHLK